MKKIAAENIAGKEKEKRDRKKGKTGSASLWLARRWIR
jgi:hypothetical protein